MSPFCGIGSPSTPHLLKSTVHYVTPTAVGKLVTELVFTVVVVVALR